MKYRLLSAAIIFSVTCALGWFCAAAGGVKWGTSDAGQLSGLVIFVAASFALLAAFLSGMHHDD